MAHNSKLNTAFANLRKAGYFARQNFQCCQSCGWAAVPQGFSDKAVFYHAQDAADMRDGRAFHIAWAGNGHEIVGHFVAAGLNVKWDGSNGSRIQVLPS